jgi:hypothetical protein
MSASTNYDVIISSLHFASLSSRALYRAFMVHALENNSESTRVLPLQLMMMAALF